MTEGRKQEEEEGREGERERERELWNNIYLPPSVNSSGDSCHFLAARALTGEEGRLNCMC